MTKIKAKILVLDDDPDILLTARVVLKQAFTEVETLSDASKLRELLVTKTYDIILSDMNFRAGETNGKEGLEILNLIRGMAETTGIITITAYGDISLAVEAMKNGALDFVVKPWDNEKLIATVTSAFNLVASRKQVEQLKQKQLHLNKDHTSEIIGSSFSVQDLFQQIKKVAATDVNVLIVGENGTGKDLVAREIHRQSLRSGEIFMKVDMGAIAENLFESELFGHKRGAFTDAREDRKGKFEVASGGTLFLDEIGNLSLPLQAKLLTVLQSGEVTPVGSNTKIVVDIRLICATNVSLEQMVEEKRFRQDLLYRFNTIQIRLPALRERVEDIPLLLQHFLHLYSRKYRKPDLQVGKSTVNKLMKYSWPGNIRELRHAVERAVILSDSNELKLNDFLIIGEGKNVGRQQQLSLDQVEKKTIKEAIQRHNGNLRKTAKELGLGRTTLYRKIQKYGL